MIRFIGAVLFACVLIFITMLEQKRQEEIERLTKRLQATASFLDGDISQQDGTVTFQDDLSQFSQIEMQQQAALLAPNFAYFWHGKYEFIGKRGKKTYIPGSISFEGTDKQQHFLNSYLLGIHPFKVDNLALPLYAIAQRKVYQLDNTQYGRPDVWQNSAEAFISLRGDCEDHAIVLADWLISEGVDAKVVLGKVPEGYHAWVVATLEGKEYILEATAKRYGKSWSHYPLAELNTDYEPEYMFNRENFWVNTDRRNITKYSGKHWQLSSTFQRTSIKESTVPAI